jgi:ubiquinone/menaquinone biosynthesis C-methylase UbiE
VRHLPGKLGPHSHVYGSDYNEKSIAWSQANIQDVKFCTNQLSPPLPFENQSLDFVYAFSVFTHLSEESCLQWAAEIKRVLKRDGLFFFTTHSDKLSEFLLPDELAQYEAEGFCMRGKVKEGKKMFTAFHSPEYVKNKLLAGFDVLAHDKLGTFKYIHAQDAWFARARQTKGQEQDHVHRASLAGS